MRERAHRSHPLLGEGDRGRLAGADPDRQVPISPYLPQQHDRLVGRHLHPDTYDVELIHSRNPMTHAPDMKAQPVRGAVTASPKA
ncbi:hypothetical protein GCM10009760_63400 [Kitasatospora kazusensis]|uniref:Uncharacterized protein n=1 Tax=Kitasatospora kazusensis TaxID=407974 RepID=A0ABN1ZM99_9ACTN